MSSFYKQQAINHYLEHIDNDLDQNINKVDDVVWVNADKILAVLQEHAILRESLAIKIPETHVANWDDEEEELPEFDRILQQILYQNRTLH